MHIISFGALFLATVLLLSSLFGAAENAVLTAIEADAEVCELPVLILDAGHGGEDGGATGTNGLLEKDLNLSLTQSLAALLRLWCKHCIAHCHNCNNCNNCDNSYKTFFVFHFPFSFLYIKSFVRSSR